MAQRPYRTLHLLLLPCIIIICPAQCHAMPSPTWKRRPFEGSLYRGPEVMIWSAVYSGWPHPHTALSARPHFLMDDMNWRRFSSVHCKCCRCSPWTPTPGSRMYGAGVYTQPTPTSIPIACLSRVAALGKCKIRVGQGAPSQRVKTWWLFGVKQELDANNDWTSGRADTVSVDGGGMYTLTTDFACILVDSF